MVITQSIYDKVVNFSRKIGRNYNKEFREDLAQQVFEKLLISNDIVEYESSYVYVVVKHTFLNERTRLNVRIKGNEAIKLGSDTSTSPNLSCEAKIDLDILLNSLKETPARYRS